MALGFNYTLSVDEDNSLRSLTKFLEKVEGQKVVLGLDFDMNALSDMLKKIQTEITNASKNLTLTFGSFRIDEDELQRTLKQAGQNTKVAANVAVNIDDGDMKGITQAFSGVPVELEREINKIKDSLTVSLNNLAQSAKNNGLQNLIPIDEIERSIKELHTTGNSLGEIRKEASFVRQEISSWSQVAKGQAAIFRTTATEAGTVADRVASINKSMETTALERYRRQLQLNLDTQIDNIKYSKEFVKLTESQKNSFNQLASAANLTETSMRGLQDEYANLNLRIKEFKQHDLAPVVRDQQKSFSSLFSAIGKGAFYFNEIGEALGITSIRLGDAVQHIRDVDEAFINVRRTMGTSQEQFNGMIDVASDIAYANGVAIESVLEMVKVYGNAGTTMEQIKAKLDIAAQFQSITGQDATQVTTSMQAIMNQFQMAQETADETTVSMQRLGDVMVGVGYSLEKDEGLAMQDIISGVETAGAVVHNAGGSFEWLASVVATLSEQMNATGDETGNAMKMIAARTLQSKEAIQDLVESGEDMSDIEIKASNAEKALGEIGVSVRESNGEFKELEDILGEVAKKWDKLNSTEKQMISEQMAGNNRRNYFISLMEGYDRVIELTDKANNSQGAMMQASERQSESLEIAINRLINSFKELYRSLMDSDGLKALIKMLDLTVQGFTKLNDFLGGGMLPTLGMVAGAFLALRIEMSAFTGQGLISGAITLFNQLGTALSGLAAKAGLARMAMGGLIGLIAGVAIAGIGKLISHFKETSYSAEKAQASMKTMSEEMAQYKDTIKQINDEEMGVVDLQSTIDQMKDLNENTKEYKTLQESANSKISEFGSTYPDIAPLLESENLLLEDKVELIQAAIDKKKEELALETLDEKGGKENIQKFADELAAKVETQRLYNEAMNKAHMAQVDAQTGLDANGNLWEAQVGSMTMTYQDLTEAITAFNSEMVMSEHDFNTYMVLLKDLKDTGHLTQEEFDELSQTFLNFGSSQGFDVDGIVKYMKTTNDAKDETEELGDVAEEAENKIRGLNSVMKETITKSGDSNKQYVETLGYIEEAAELLEGLGDGLDFSDMEALADSDIMADFTGSIQNAADVTDHLKTKMQELQDLSYTTAANMALDQDNAWQDIVATSANALQVQDEDFGAFVDACAANRDIDIQNAENAAQAEMQATVDLLTGILTGYADVNNDKAGYRKTDMSNVVSFLNAQGDKETLTVDQLSGIWAEFYKAKAKALADEKATLSRQVKAMEGYVGDPYAKQKLASVEAQISALDSANTMISTYFGNVSTTFKDISNSLSQAATGAEKAIGPLRRIIILPTCWAWRSP